MNELVFRFTLNNSVEGQLVINEPDGWAEAKLKLERDKEYHSIVEFYEQPLTFYGSPHARYDGGYEYVLNILETQGPDADVNFLVEISDDAGDTYETLFTGLIDLSTWTETDFYIASCGIVRDDFWSRFYNQRETSINVQSPTDVYGENREVLSTITEDLTSQIIVHQYEGNLTSVENDYVEYSIPAGEYAALNFNEVVEDEIKDRFTLPNIDNPEIPSELFAVKYGGEYVFQINVNASTTPLAVLGSKVTAVDLKIRINDDAPISCTKTDNGIDGVNGSTTFTYDNTFSPFTLSPSDLIKIYWENTSGVTKAFFASGKPFSYMFIQAYTVFPDSTAESMLLHELTQSVLDRIIGQDDSLYSEYLGNTRTQRADYTEDACFSDSSIKKGLHVKGFSFDEKPLAISFNKIWNGLNPMFNLGLGYETSPNSPERQIIRIEPKSHFYNPTTVLNLDFVNNIEHTLDVDKIYKLINIGYKKWESENISGLDEVQTKHQYAVPLKKVGTEITLESDFIAAALAQENTRRQSVEKSKDYRLDEDFFITHLYTDGSSYVPYTADNIGSADPSGVFIQDAEFRYNLLFTPIRNLYRWRDFLSGGVQFNSDFEFKTGEGNTDALIDDGGGACGIGSISENADVPITDEFLFGIDVYRFEHPLTWAQYKTLRDNPKNAIGVSTTDSDHVSFFLVSLEWSPVEPKGNFVVIKAPVQEPPVSDCPTFDSTIVKFDRTDITWDCD